MHGRPEHIVTRPWESFSFPLYGKCICVCIRASGGEGLNICHTSRGGHLTHINSRGVCMRINKYAPRPPGEALIECTKDSKGDRNKHLLGILSPRYNCPLDPNYYINGERDIIKVVA